MIRYRVSATELRALINAHDPRWLTKARRRTERFRRLGRYDERRTCWGDVKPVYMRLQHNKCAYCERQLAGEPYGAIEHDLEHFRPKGAVRRWPTAEIKRQRRISYRFATGEDWQEGYYLLAYHPLNYVVACKPCNTVLKASFFPIYGPRGSQSDDPTTLVSERPLLISPLGDDDNDPEEVITFLGIVAVPRRRSGYKAYRDRVTIDFFDLNGREDLRRERSHQVFGLWLALEGIANAATATLRADYEQYVQLLVATASPHCACARAFQALYHRDREAALRIVDWVKRYLNSMSSASAPTSPPSSRSST